MSDKIFMVLVIGLFVGAMAGVAFADAPIDSGNDRGISSQMPYGSTGMENADPSSISGPTGTGSVPEVKPDDPADEPDSTFDTHYNPFYPDQKNDGGGGY